MATIIWWCMAVEFIQGSNMGRSGYINPSLRLVIIIWTRAVLFQQPQMDCLCNDNALRRTYMSTPIVFINSMAHSDTICAMTVIFQQLHMRLLKNHRSYKNPILLLGIDISNRLKALPSRIFEVKI